MKNITKKYIQNLNKRRFEKLLDSGRKFTEIEKNCIKY